MTGGGPVPRAARRSVARCAGDRSRLHPPRHAAAAGRARKGMSDGWTGWECCCIRGFRGSNAGSASARRWMTRPARRCWHDDATLGSGADGLHRDGQVHDRTDVSRRGSARSGMPMRRCIGSMVPAVLRWDQCPQAFPEAVVDGAVSRAGAQAADRAGCGGAAPGGGAGAPSCRCGPPRLSRHGGCGDRRLRRAAPVRNRKRGGFRQRAGGHGPSRTCRRIGSCRGPT